jgi:hypothetical protein
MGQIGSLFAPQFPDALIVSIGGAELAAAGPPVVLGSGGDGRKSSVAD